MGDVSIIARRLKDGHVQFGWSGNGGYYKTVGWAIEKWYTTPEMVEYLFGLGQLELLVNPLTDKDQHPWYHTTPAGEPHYLGTCEDDIFSKIMFVDYAYFYDTDGHWYYICPGFFRLKLRLDDVRNYLEQSGKEMEFDYLHTIWGYIIREILTTWYQGNPDFNRFAQRHGLDDEKTRALLKDLDKLLYRAERNGDIDEDVFHELAQFAFSFHNGFRSICDYFDKWVVMEPAEETGYGKLLIRKKENPRKETIDWV